MTTTAYRSTAAPTIDSSLVSVAPNGWHGQPDPSGYRLSGHVWGGFRFVVLKQYLNGWHVGFTNDPNGSGDHYWQSGISEGSARNLFAMAQAGA